MKRVIYLFLAISLVSLVSAIPEIQLQHNSWQQQETVLGKIEGSLTLLSRDNMHIYEGRREVLVERDVFAHNGIYYFYIIFPSYGEYTIKFGEVLYNSSGIKSINLEKKINITKLEANKTQVLTINPGFYYGEQPQLTLINPGNSLVDLNYNSAKISLNPGESKKITLNVSDGFSLITLDSYKKFSIPIFKINLNTIDINSTIKNSTNINNTNAVEIKISVPQNLIVQSLANQTTEYFFNIVNLGDDAEINVKSLGNILQIDNFSLLRNESKQIEIQIKSNFSGAFSEELQFFYNSEKIATTKVQVLIFQNNQTAQNYNNSLNKSTNTLISCTQMGGNLCSDNEDCFSDFSYNLKDEGICCEAPCVKKITSDNSGFLYFLFGIVILLIIGSIGYYLYSRSKKVSLIKPEDKFKELDKRYKNNISRN
jgi:hypothetical protein